MSENESEVVVSPEIQKNLLENIEAVEKSLGIPIGDVWASLEGMITFESIAHTLQATIDEYSVAMDQYGEALNDMSIVLDGEEIEDEDWPTVLVGYESHNENGEVSSFNLAIRDRYFAHDIVSWTFDGSDFLVRVGAVVLSKNKRCYCHYDDPNYYLDPDFPKSPEVDDAVAKMKEIKLAALKFFPVTGDAQSIRRESTALLECEGGLVLTVYAKNRLHSFFTLVDVFQPPEPPSMVSQQFLAFWASYEQSGNALLVRELKGFYKSMIQERLETCLFSYWKEPIHGQDEEGQLEEIGSELCGLILTFMLGEGYKVSFKIGVEQICFGVDVLHEADVLASFDVKGSASKLKAHSLPALQKMRTHQSVCHKLQEMVEAFYITIGWQEQEKELDEDDYDEDVVEGEEEPAYKPAVPEPVSEAYSKFQRRLFDDIPALSAVESTTREVSQINPKPKPSLKVVRSGESTS